MYLKLSLERMIKTRPTPPKNDGFGAYKGRSFPDPTRTGSGVRSSIVDPFKGCYWGLWGQRQGRLDNENVGLLKIASK